MRPVHRGTELAASAPKFVLPANAPVQQYLTVPLQRPAGGSVEVPAGSPTSAFTYSPNDASVGDLDGDGEYQIVVKWDPSNARDNASAGLSGRQLIEAYKIDGTRLWRIDLGRNIRAGPHYTQFMVYDLDGDGRAEVACKTADGTVDGAGTVIGDATKDYRSLLVPTDGIQVPATNDARYGKVLAGPEYFTIFDGLTGAALATTDYMPGAIRSTGGAASAATATTTTTATAAIGCSPPSPISTGDCPAWSWPAGTTAARFSRHGTGGTGS